jgi:acetyl-CoA C-acetyltransferase
VHPPSSTIAPRTPVLVGVGTANAAAPVEELLTAACVAAGRDASVPALLPMVDRLNLAQGSWSLADPSRAVARTLGASGALRYRYEVGVSQQEIVDDALDAISGGHADVVIVLGGEARAYARAGGTEPDDPSLVPDVTVTRPADFVAPIEIAAGIVWPPVQQYALIENALAAHEHSSPRDHRAQIAALWARFNEVASRNPLAAFPAAKSAEAIAEPGPKNRPLAHPYNLWHSSQWTVNQAAALLFCSAERARALRVPMDRWIFPHIALHASESVTLTARRDLHAWPAMELLGRTAESHLGQPLHDLPIMEIYSCFPAAVQVQQRALGLDLDGTPTVTGGMSFAGGPFNNFVFQSMAAVVHLLRAAPGARALVTTVSGMLSKPGLAVWSSQPPARGQSLLLADLGEQVKIATPTRGVAAPNAAHGPAEVVSFTVTYDTVEPLRPVRTVIVADLADGVRVAATCEDAAVARQALSEGITGQTVQIEHTTFSL